MRFADEVGETQPCRDCREIGAIVSIVIFDNDDALIRSNYLKPCREVRGLGVLAMAPIRLSSQYIQCPAIAAEGYVLFVRPIVNDDPTHCAIIVLAVHQFFADRPSFWTSAGSGQ